MLVYREEASLRDELLMGAPKESAVISSFLLSSMLASRMHSYLHDLPCLGLSILPDSLKISVSQVPKPSVLQV